MEYVIGATMLAIVLLAFVVKCNRNNKRYDDEVEAEFEQLKAKAFDDAFEWDQANACYVSKDKP